MNYKSINTTISYILLVSSFVLAITPFFLYHTDLPSYFPKIVQFLGLPPKDFTSILANLHDSMHINIIRNSGMILFFMSLFNLLFIKFSSYSSPKDVFFFLLVFNVFNYIFFTNSYICDDSLITCRTADNFVHGYGLRWNVIERVQSFTNPLWLFLIIILYYPLHFLAEPHAAEKFWLILVVLCYTFSLLLIWKISHYLIQRKQYIALLLVAATLFSSRAFADFICSGMENPLSFVLLAWFYSLFFQNKFDKSADFTKMYFIASLAFLNRQDNILFCILPLLFLFYKQYQLDRKFWNVIKSALLGFAPTYIWLVFAVIYFGFPFPNTYYAKMDFGYTDIVIKQSINYLYTVSIKDSVTMLSILMSLGLAIYFFSRHTIIYLASILTYFAYLLFTGGDFMGTRFLGVPFVLSIIFFQYPIKYKLLRNKYLIYFIVVLMFFYNFFYIESPWKYFIYHRKYKSISHYSTVDPHIFNLKQTHNRIFFDKLFYFKPSNILFYNYISFPFEKYLHIYHTGLCRSCSEKKKTLHITFGGMDGVCMGSKHTLIDGYALTEPLLARLPVKVSEHGFFVAHIWHDFPLGLILSYQKNQNLLTDKTLAKYYDKILVITRGDLFTKERWKYIWQLNTTERRYKNEYLREEKKYSEESH